MTESKIEVKERKTYSIENLTYEQMQKTDWRRAVTVNIGTENHWYLKR